MKIAVTADLHYGITRSHQIKEMINRIMEQSPDAIAIGGDVGEVIQGVNSYTNCLRMFTETKLPVLVVSGNHDLWTYDEPDKPDSLTLWNEIIPTRTRAARAIWLEGENWVSGKVAVVGSYLHYNYTGRDTVGPTVGFADEYFAVNKKNILPPEGEHMIGLPSDIEFAKQIGDRFLTRLQSAQADPNIESIVVVTHVSCMECQMSRNPHDASWSFGTPYFGNLSYENDIKQCSKVKFVVSGHSHQPSYTVINRGKTADLVVHNLGSDYRKPDFVMLNIGGT